MQWPDGVEARAGEEAVGEVRSLVVLPPDDPGQRGVQGDGDGVEDVPGGSVERREEVAARLASHLQADLKGPSVKLEAERKSEGVK